MPRRNATGPMGHGPMTGRGLGPCGGGLAYRGHASFRGAGMGFGSGYGAHFCANGFYPHATLTADQQKEILSERKSFLENELKDLQKQLDEL